MFTIQVMEVRIVVYLLEIQFFLMKYEIKTFETFNFSKTVYILFLIHL